MLDLLQTGKYGLLAHQQLLGTTSNNITNVNTVGYVRQNTNVYTNVVDWGVGDLYTRRMYDKYVQREMFRDQGNVGYNDSYLSGMDTVDKMLSDDSMSISTSLNKYFSAMQDAIQNPTSTATRRELLTQLENMVDRFHTLNQNMQSQLQDVNSKIDDTAVTINQLVDGIYDLNKQISYLGPEGQDMALQLLDKRDMLINELSSYVDINTTIESDGSLSVYMGNGQLLVGSDAKAHIQIESNALDPNLRDVYVVYNTKDNPKIKLSSDVFGGSLGGYLQSTKEIQQAMRDLGQVAIAFADAMNEQNKAGFTLENIAGENLINIKELTGTSNNSDYEIRANFIPRQGSNVTANDYQLEKQNGSNDMKVFMIVDGKKVDVTADFDFSVDASGNYNIVPKKIDGQQAHGISFTISRKDGTAVDPAAIKNSTKMLVQPTMHSAYDISLNITKPEDFAFASAVRGNTGSNNYGNATISMNGVTSVGPDMPITTVDGKPVFNTNVVNAAGDSLVPTRISIDTNGNYLVMNDKGQVLGTAPASSNGQNIFANTTWNADVQNYINTHNIGPNYPGYDVSITGTVKHQDNFFIEINEGGIADNSNGLLLGQLQQKDLVKGNGNNKMTFTEGYSDLVSDLGSNVMAATQDLEATKAKCEQTQELFSSCAGVNLDEEAANLIKYQQAYTACAKIITASQTVFDSLIAAI